MGDNTYRELITLGAFRQAISEADRIVIDDGARPSPIVHHPECSFVKEESFTEKVLENQNRSGRYYAAMNTKIAESHRAARCGHLLLTRVRVDV